MLSHANFSRPEESALDNFLLQKLDIVPKEELHFKRGTLPAQLGLWRDKLAIHGFGGSGVWGVGCFGVLVVHEFGVSSHLIDSADIAFRYNKE
jgi:hypothetical protein